MMIGYHKISTRSCIGNSHNSISFYHRRALHNRMPNEKANIFSAREGFYADSPSGNIPLYVIFDRKYEYVNKPFADLFGMEPEKFYSSGFDPLSLVAPECRQSIKDIHSRGYRREVNTNQFQFTGIKPDDSRIQCLTFVIYVPYKWGIAIHGTLRDLNKSIDSYRSYAGHGFTS